MPTLAVDVERRPPLAVDKCAPQQHPGALRARSDRNRTRVRFGRPGRRAGSSAGVVGRMAGGWHLRRPGSATGRRGGGEAAGVAGRSDGPAQRGTGTPAGSGRPPVALPAAQPRPQDEQPAIHAAHAPRSPPDGSRGSCSTARPRTSGCRSPDTCRSTRPVAALPQRRCWYRRRDSPTSSSQRAGSGPRCTRCARSTWCRG